MRITIIKKSLLLLFLIFNFQAFSQHIVSTKYVEGYIWDENNSQWWSTF